MRRDIWRVHDTCARDGAVGEEMVEVKRPSKHAATRGSRAVRRSRPASPKARWVGAATVVTCGLALAAAASGAGIDLGGSNTACESATVGVSASSQSAWQQIAKAYQRESGCHLDIEALGVSTWRSAGLDGAVFDDVSDVPAADTSRAVVDVVARSPLVTVSRSGGGQATSIRISNPNESAIGRLALIGLAREINPQGGPLQLNLLDAHAADRGVVGLVRRLSTESSASGIDLPAVAAGAHVVTTEAEAWRTVRAHGQVPLSIDYLDAGRLQVRVPLVRRSGSDVLRGFGNFLRSVKGRAALSSVGLRAADSVEGPSRAEGFTPAELALAPAPIKQEVDGALQVYRSLATPSSKLMVIDTSGSMRGRLDGAGGRSKIGVVREVTQLLLDIAPPSAYSSLMTFHSDARDTPHVDLPVPSASNLNAAHRKQMTTALGTATVAGGTPLYLAVKTAYQYALAHYQPGMPNRIVLFSDGRNGSTNDGLTLQALRQYLASAQDKSRPVTIAAIGYGSDADMPALRQISSATGGFALEVRAFDQYPAALQKAFFFFG
jgi:uncharacterized protein YegL